MLKNLIKTIENSPVSFWQATLLIYTAAFFRTFLENYANADNQNNLTSVIDTFFHYPLWFLGVFLSAFIILKLLTGEKIEKISRLGAVFSIFIMLPPILDIIINKGAAIRYIFITGNASEILNSFLSFFGGDATGIGIKTEVLFALLFSGYYIFKKTKKIWRSLVGALLLYTAIFAFLILPTLLFGINNLLVNNPQPITAQSTIDLYYSQEINDAMTVPRTFILDKNNFETEKVQNIKNQYSATISIVVLIVGILLLAWWFFLYSSKKFIAMLKNFRYLRIMHYFLMLSLGIYIGISFVGAAPLNAIFDVLSFLAIFLALLFAWLFSVWENDEIDMESDKIDSPERPLGRGIFSAHEWRDIKFLFLFLSLNFAFLAGLYPFIFTLLFIAVYHIYSAPPLHLKRFLGISSVLIAVNALIAVFMGFFMTAGTENLRAFPSGYLFGILAIFFLAENVKNLKDIRGDKRAGMNTLPIVLGEKWAKPVVGGFVFVATLLVPVVFYQTTSTIIVALFFGSVLYLLINKGKYREKYIFIVYFIFISVFIFTALFFGGSDSILKQESEAPARKGFQWLYNYPGKLSGPSTPYIIKKIGDTYCDGSPEIEKVWKKMMPDFADRPYLPVFERLFAGPDYRLSDTVVKILQTPQGYYNDVLPQGLYCDLYPVKESFAANTFDGIEKETGYDLTHKFWTSILFKNNGCVADGYNLDEVIAKAANKIAEEQEATKNKVDDLYTERTAFLLYFGFEDLVKKEWIKNIILSQKESGAWATPMFINPEQENPHTTALAVWALSEYSNTCPIDI